MTPLVSLQEAKDHVRVATSQDETDLALKLAIAQSIVLNHCKLTAIPDVWIDVSPPDENAIESEDSPPLMISVPGDIRAAILLITGELFMNLESSTSEPLSPTVIALLQPFRTPTMA